MNTSQKIHLTRIGLIAAVLFALALGLFGLLVGPSLPWIVVNVAAWTAVIVLLVIVLHTYAKPRRSSTWRPGDEGRAR
ncbi:MAG TPA: hypothetical protein VK039_13065 [Brevibacterium sp.]|nr:hypothetical protein [Brevibacterium sp.]